jgi:hypothetical protein
LEAEGPVVLATLMDIVVNLAKPKDAKPDETEEEELARLWPVEARQ